MSMKDAAGVIDDKYLPKYLELPDKSVREAVLQLLDGEWVGVRFVSELVRMPSGRWLIKLDPDLLALSKRRP